MDEITKLDLELTAFAAENPGQVRFVEALRGAVERITAQFDGEARAALLGKARETFERQIEISREARRTRDALRRLEESQGELIQSLTQLLAGRPPDATLH